MTSPTPSRLTVAPMGEATWNSSLYWPVSRSSLRSCCVRVSKLVLGIFTSWHGRLAHAQAAIAANAWARRPCHVERSRLWHLQDDLDRLSGLHQLEPALEVFQRQLVRDDRVELQPARQHEVLDLEPRLIH